MEQLIKFFKAVPLWGAGVLLFTVACQDSEELAIDAPLEGIETRLADVGANPLRPKT